jgi:PIN domain nuclease of toxin-antitoxin system
MTGLVLDTHSLVWYLLGSQRLSSTAGHEIDACLERGDSLKVASVSLVELIYLVEKKRLPEIVKARLAELLDIPDAGVLVVPLDRQIADTVSAIDRSSVPDMPDRIIAATALYLDLPVVTRDGKIRSSNIRTIW